MPKMLTELLAATADGGPFALVVALALQGVVVVAVAWGLATLLRRRSAALRHLVWALAVGTLLLLPLAASLPGPALPVLPPEGAPVSTEAAIEGTPSPVGSVAASVAPAASEAAATPKPAAAAPARWRPGRLVGLLYLAGVLLSLLPLMLGLVRVRRLAGATTPLDGDRAWGDLLAGLRSRLGIARPVALRRSEAVTVPVTWGWRRPVVVVPAAAAEWPLAERRNALLHELAHVARGDWLVQLVARLACALHWFDPLVRLAARRLAAEAERACDDRVLVGGAEGPDYADQLVLLARRARHGWAPGYAAIAMARPSDLARRVAALLDESIRRGSVRRRSAMVAAATVLLLTIAVAPARLVRAAAEGSPTQAWERTTYGPHGLLTGDRSLAGPDAMPLMRAAVAGDRSAVELLLDRGADPNRVVPGQGFALLLAASAGHADVVELLLGRGADPNLVDGAGNRWEGLPRTALNGAARAGCLDCARMLLERGARVDAAPQGDATPLMAAARYGRLDLVRFLIDRGADVNARVVGDGTPLIEAAREGHRAIVELLLDRGARPDVAVVGDGNPLIVAAAGGHLEIARLLLDRGADPDVWVPGDESALYHAVERSDLELARLLLDRGADPTVHWPGDGNALAVAGENGDREMLELLLDRLPEGLPAIDTDSESERESDHEESRETEGPGAWLVVDGPAHRLIVPDGAVVEFQGTGRLEFPAGPVSVALPAGHRLVVDGEPMTGQAVITGDPQVSIVTADGRVAWRLRAAPWSALDQAGTRIQDTDRTRGARVDTSGDLMRFYLAVDEGGHETFFEPERTSGREAPEAPRSAGSGGEAVLALTSALGDENAFVRRAAVNSLMDLGATRDPTVRRALRPLLEDPDEGARQAAEAALGLRERVRSNPVEGRSRRVETRPVPELLAELGSEDPKQRVAALDALGNVAEPETVTSILSLLEDPNEIVRQRAANALGNIGSRIAVDGLVAALGDADDQVRQAAGYALGAIGDVRAVSALIAAARDGDDQVRQAAVSALGQIGDRRATPVLIAALEDADEHVRQVAAGGLGRLYR